MSEPDPDIKPPHLTGGLKVDSPLPTTDGAGELIKAVAGARGAPPLTGPARAPFPVLRELGADLDPVLANPIAVAVQPDGGIAVLDQPACADFRLTHFLPSGPPVSAQIVRGTGDDQLVAPAGLTVDAHGNAFIPDADAGRIQKFGPDGNWMAGYAAAGFEGTPFSGPRDVAIDPAGRLYVADTNNSRVVMLLPDGELGWTLDRFDGPGGPDELYEPCSVAVASSRLYVADTNNNRVLVFDAHRRLLPGPGETDFAFPSGVRATADGRVYVADHGNLRIRRFDPAGHCTGELTLVDKLDAGPVVPGGAQLGVDAGGHIVLVQPLRQTAVVLAFTGGSS